MIVEDCHFQYSSAIHSLYEGHGILPTKTVVNRDLCSELQVLEDLKRMRKKAMVSIIRIKFLLRLIREISVRREFV